MFEPLLDDLADDGIRSYLVSTDFKRVLVDLGIIQNWKNAVEEESKKRTFFIAGSDMLSIDSWEAFQNLILNGDPADEDKPEFYSLLTGIIEGFYQHVPALKTSLSTLSADLKRAGFSSEQIKTIVSTATKAQRDVLKVPKAIAPKSGSEANGGRTVDLGIVTALTDPELEAVRRLLDDYEEVKVNGIIAFRGAFRNSSRTVRVMAYSSGAMGVASTVVAAMRLAQDHHPEYVCMTGISGGIRKPGRNLGDIIVPIRSIDYQNGKIAYDKELGRDVFLPTREQCETPKPLLAKLSSFCMKRSNISGIQDDWQGEDMEAKLSVHQGSLYCGSAVIASSSMSKTFMLDDREAVGVEMESYGMMVLNRYFESVKFFVVKSISDFADEAKDDSCRRYAAYTSAAFVKRFALSELFASEPVE